METNAIQSETVPASTSLLASQVLNAKESFVSDFAIRVVYWFELSVHVRLLKFCLGSNYLKRVSFLELKS